MNYKIAIPSYKRPETLKNKTLRLLQHYDIDPNLIHIFVANKKEEDLYRNKLEPDSYHKLIVGRKGIKNIRNFMANYFDEGQRIFYIDDDISKLFQNYNDPRIKSKKTQKPRIIRKIDSNYDRANNYLTELPSLQDLIEEGFRKSGEKGIDNWGVYPVENPYFMKPTTKLDEDFLSTKLNYIMGGLTGVVNNKKAEKRTLDDKEDYERSIKYYLKDGGVLRFNNVCARTNCYKEPGGMQVERTPQRIHDSAVYLCEKYPELCTLNTQKKSGMTEVRLRDTRNNNNNNFDNIHLENQPINNNNANHTEMPHVAKSTKKLLKYIRGNNDVDITQSNINTYHGKKKKSKKNNDNQVNLHNLVNQDNNYTKKKEVNHKKKSRQRIRKNYLGKRKISNVSYNNNNTVANTNHQNLEEAVNNDNESGKNLKRHITLSGKMIHNDLSVPNRTDGGMENVPNHNTYDRRNEYNQTRNETVDSHLGSSSNIIQGKNHRPNTELNLSNVERLEEVNLNEQRDYQNLPNFY